MVYYHRSKITYRSRLDAVEIRCIKSHCWHKQMIDRYDDLSPAWPDSQDKLNGTRNITHVTIWQIGLGWPLKALLECFSTQETTETDFIFFKFWFWGCHSIPAFDKLHTLKAESEIRMESHWDIWIWPLRLCKRVFRGPAVVYSFYELVCIYLELER